MRAAQWILTQVGKEVSIALVLVGAVGLLGWVGQDQPKIEATIFSYDGKDFIRTKTTLVTEDGKSAVNTKLEHSSPAYKALIHKHSYVGDATVFGRKYDADYAPLTGADGKLTGAVFVAVSK